jgi:class 3 adenylate cyclase/TolB-like protein/tetratricopeptide (TPR) repeat protein
MADAESEVGANSPVRSRLSRLWQRLRVAKRHGRCDDGLGARPAGRAAQAQQGFKKWPQIAHTVDLDTANVPARVIRAVLVVDLVESVRLIQDDEVNVVRRWREFMERVITTVLPAHGGRLVKSLGDGLMLDFPRVQPAVAAAFEIQRLIDQGNEGSLPNRHLLLRMGVHVGALIADAHDVYGHGVNLAARLASLAGPGEIVVSADVRDQLTPVLDAEVEDLGECYLKHVTNPVRAYRVGTPGPRPVIERGTSSMAELLPTIAVIPFAVRSGFHEHYVLGEMLADEVITALSQASELQVISRLSTTAFRGRGAPLAEVSAHLNATYVLSGGYRVSGNLLTLNAELAEAKTGRMVWAKSLKGHVDGIVSGKDELIDCVVTEVSAAVMARELQRSQSQALPTLQSYTLLMGAIALMHRLSPHQFDRAHEMLEALAERAPRQALPHAWLAKWHVMRVQQGWTKDPKNEAMLAVGRTRRALDADPHCSLALVVDGLVHTNLLKRLDLAQEKYEHALQINPSDSLAWLLKGCMHAFKGEGKLAMEGTELALKLSPLDPQRFYYDSLAATAAMSAGAHERAIELAQRSLRANRTHTSTFRALAISQSLLGRIEDARKTVGELLKLEPALTVRKWLERSPASEYATGPLWAHALREAGMPE